MHDPVSFGLILKQHRRAQDLTQEQLARLVGCAAITIKKIEADALRPSRQIVERLADVLAVAAAERSDFIQSGRALAARTIPSTPMPANAGPRTGLIVTPDDTNLLRALLETSLPALRNPYKGLRPFTEADASDFFGRTALTQQLLARLAGESTIAHFLAVVGPSGSGKSSVVRAGVIPAIRQGGLPGSEHWFVAELLPGDHPLDELEAALLRVAINPPASLLEQLQADERGLLRAVNRVLPCHDDSELLLVIDQFEEIFTLVEDEASRLHFLNSLLVAVLTPRSRLRVIITLRADFYDRPLLYRGLGDLVRQCTEVVLPLTPDELEEAIIRPAVAAGVTVEPELIVALIADVGAQPGVLPLLQYVLTELFDHQQDRLLSLAAYRASGGVLGTLACRADELYADLDTQGQAVARQLFLRLVTLGEGVEDTRRRVRRAELAGDDPVMDRVIDIYGRSRLLTFDRDLVTHESTVEVAHEALIRTWGRLRSWLNASRDDLRVQRRLMAAATEWTKGERETSFLVTGTQLAQFAALATSGNLALSLDEQAYLAACLTERDRQAVVAREREARDLALAHQVATAQRRAANRLRILAGVLAVFLLLATGLSLFAFDKQAQATRNAAAATVAQGQALNSAATAAANFTRSEAQRLAAEANTLYQAHGNAEVIALLSIRSLRTQYSSQGDAAIEAAATLDYPRQQFVGHTEYLWGVAYAPDGKTVLTGGGDKTARLWDVQSGKELRRFTGHAADVFRVAFSPDGTTVLTGSSDNTARLWDIRTGKQLQLFTGHTDAVDCVAYSPDGKYVVTGSLDKTARLWDALTGRQLQLFAGHTASVFGVAFSPNGQYVLTGSEDKTARLWDTQTGQQIRVFAGHTGVVQSVAYSHDGKYVLTGSYDKTARLWDARTATELRRFTGHQEFIKDVAFSPDGGYVLTGSDDKTARLWDTRTGTELRRYIGHASFVFGVAFSPDGKHVLTGSLDKTARLWNVPTSAEQHLPTITGHLAGVTQVAFSPDGRSVLTGSSDKSARLWDAHTGQQLRIFSGHTDTVQTVRYSPDGRSVLTGSSDKSARLWDAQTGQQLQIFASSAFLNDVAYSPNGRSVLTGGGENTAKLWDAQTGQQLQVFSGHTTQVFSVAYSPDSRYVVTGSFDKTARLWDAQTGRQLRVFNLPDGAASIAFAPDGRSILTGSWDGMVRLWDVATGQELRHFTGHTDVVWSLAFSPDGKYVLTGSQDWTARLWSTETGAELRRFTGHNGTLNGVAFSPDGHTVLTGSSDGTARLWDADYHDTIAYLCGRLLRDFSDDERAQYGIADQAPTCP